MGAIGTENSKACMLFILRMLHAQLQRQVHLPEAERPRVPLLVDEAHYVASGENVVDQIATHRAAGLEAAFGLQYFAQLGSASEHQQKILKGVLNLLQSRFLFRMGDAQDAEQATRIAMAVYATMIRDDPDSRARLRVTPEQALNFPNYFCLASWIANGTRAPSFMGQTYPLPDVGDEWADRHLAAQDERVGPYPEQLESTLATDTVPANDESGGSNGAASDDTPAVDARKASMPPTNENSEPTAAQPAKHEVQVDYEPPSDDAVGLADSPVRRLVGQPRSQEAIAKEAVDDHELPLSDTLRELTFLDRINEIAPADQLEGASGLPRLYDEDYAILALLDRVGLAPPSLIGRAALPGRATRSVNDRLIKLYRHGLIARHNTGLRERTRTDGKAPVLYSLTRRGLQVAQGRTPAPAISPKREWRPIEQPRAGRLAHDLHALGWAIEFHRTVGELATDRWRTPRYATGRYPVPQVGSGQRRHPITITRHQGPGWPGDHRPRAQDVHRDQARPLARAPLRAAQAHVRPARRDRPHRAALLQPRQVPRLRRLPLRLGARPPALPRPGHPPRRRVREPQPARRARLRPRGRRADDRTDRRHGHPSRALVLRRARPPLLRRRGRHPPRRSFGAGAATVAAEPARASHRQPRTQARRRQADRERWRDGLTSNWGRPSRLRRGSERRCPGGCFAQFCVVKPSRVRPERAPKVVRPEITGELAEMGRHRVFVVKIARGDLDHLVAVVAKPGADPAILLGSCGIAVQVAAQPVEIDADAFVLVMV